MEHYHSAAVKQADHTIKASFNSSRLNRNLVLEKSWTNCGLWIPTCIALVLATDARIYEESDDMEDVGNGHRHVSIIALSSRRECGGW